MSDDSIRCWETKGHKVPYGMCCVEYNRLKELLSSHMNENKPDTFFTHSYEIRIRGCGIGNNYSVLFDGDTDPIDITHSEHF